MTTIDSILSRLTQAVSGTDKELFTEEELTKFATFYLDKWDENRQSSESSSQTCLDNAESRGRKMKVNTSEDVIAESFVDYWWETDRTCRRCSECGKLMREGYCLDMGVAYYCSRDCLHSEYTDEEWTAECEDNDQSYYTEW
ncbi:MAG: hypothetical protein Q4B58_08920 [Bacteroidales bacterium]|nr:hypothetical protein [Bacteroidales bacterium]